MSILGPLGLEIERTSGLMARNDMPVFFESFEGLVTARPASQTRQHGIAAYRKGCPCDICAKANRERGPRYRRKKYEAREPRPGDGQCLTCLCWFHPKGLAHHEYTCTG